MAKWIWANEESYIDDSYVGFKKSFSKTTGKTVLRVSSDSFVVAYLNGELVGFTGCADYPHFKLYDEFDLTDKILDKNELYCIVWYHGEDTQTYLRSDPGFWFEIIDEEGLVTESDETTLSRHEYNFKHNYCKTITFQLGYSFYYDNTVVNDEEYLPSKYIEKMLPQKRQQKPLVLDGRIPVTYTQMEDHILVDFGREVAGYADLDFVSSEDQEILVAFGEHLEIGKVSREIGGRDFSFEIKAKKGQNKIFLPFRRFACRYFEIYNTASIDINYFGMQHVYYPLTEKKKRFDDQLLQKIYDVSVRTLRLCMHEHYEDCPWREQALYALDSRNQMIFGYQAFRETEYQRSNLLLINQGLRPDGLLTICFPAGKDAPIPFFSLAFILEVCEYAMATGDMSIIKDTEKTISVIIDTFSKNIGENGLIPAFAPPFWNFYEWSEGNDGDLAGSRKGIYDAGYHLILNAMYVYVLGMYNKVAGKNFDVDTVREAIKTNLFDSERGLYKIANDRDLVGQLGNALAVLCGLGTDEILEKIAYDKTLTPATLSMKPFVYDALLTAGDKYRDFVIDDIKKVYKKMLDYGATSFWETELGWEDFDKAGSLCHGWSAAPVYYLSILGLAKDE